MPDTGCVHVLNDCSSGDLCIIGSCNNSTGLCFNETMVCDDESACTKDNCFYGILFVCLYLY